MSHLSRSLLSASSLPCLALPAMGGQETELLRIVLKRPLSVFTSAMSCLSLFFFPLCVHIGSPLGILPLGTIHCPERANTNSQPTASTHTKEFQCHRARALAAFLQYRGGGSATRQHCALLAPSSELSVHLATSTLGALRGLKLGLSRRNFSFFSRMCRFQSA